MHTYNIHIYITLYLNRACLNNSKIDFFEGRGKQYKIIRISYKNISTNMHLNICASILDKSNKKTNRKLVSIHSLLY